MVIQYKCPSCGADMEFDAETGKMKCKSCGHAEKAEDMVTTSGEDPDAFLNDYEEFEEETSYDTYGEDIVNQYLCNHCGAVIIAGKDTAATRCEFCGSPVVLGDRLQGELAPTNVIPFKITKEEAEEAFRKWCRHGLLLKSDFKQANRIKSLTGMYVPFWLFDVKSQGEVNAHCIRQRTFEQGDYIITETKHYDVFRKVDIDYQKIPADASEKMNDVMMDKLEPFQYEDMKKFQTPYLAGYLAEKYNYTDKELFPRVQQRVKRYTESYIRSTIIGYKSVQFMRKDLWEYQKNAEYTLLPVWMFCYDYKQAEHNFYMNGQTGKIVGKPPIDAKKVALCFLIASVISYGILALLILLWINLF